ncbi:NUDIX domain-containing protein [Rhizobiaceae bacterium n13]|uniref:NUDIX domain-containing protein n=1 Tax=Ferirhizobium litorale TaxID=2927786 RepID=A0AAE3QBY0_9HYPH|nr:NUDIX domain-containing protein [Fererhizobium litorale]MDI7863294.1 NUDIX domain-containing protein [Fererhizobium litorale]MDI7922972.1 NUDIX domain-containing protein [Fererhizobium litorale]
MPVPGTDIPGLGTGLAVLRDGKLLLYKRLKAPEAGFWNIVGGKVDHMEPAESAARREATEETGLAIGNIDLLCTTEQIVEADRQHWVSLIYVTDDFSGEPALVEPDKLSDFGWFGRDELPEPLSAFAQAAIANLTEDELR